ncbi:MAG: OmpA family protein [bacterium]
MRCKSYVFPAAAAALIFLPSAALTAPAAETAEAPYLSPEQTEKKTEKVSVEAAPFIFSPNNDGDLDETGFRIQVQKDIKKIKSWSMDIRNSDGVSEWIMDGEDLPRVVMWNGRDSNGIIVPDGRYDATFSILVKKKVSFAASASVVVDNSPPSASLEVSTTVISPDSDGKSDSAVLRVEASDLTGIGRWQLKITGEKDASLVRFYGGKSEVPSEIVWDGKDSNGKVVPNGDYFARLVMWDIIRNKGDTEPQKIKVLIPPKVVPKEIKVKEEDRGLKVNLSSNIMFKTGKTELNPASYKALDEVAELIKAYPENKVAIEGHTDSVGSESANERISLARARAIYSYLVEKGISRERFIVKGFGEATPIASNKNRDGRMRNRRVEIIILKSPKK